MKVPASQADRGAHRGDWCSHRAGQAGVAHNPPTAAPLPRPASRPAFCSSAVPLPGPCCSHRHRKRVLPLANQADANVGSRRQSRPRKAKHHAQQPLVAPLHRGAAQEPGRLQQMPGGHGGQLGPRHTAMPGQHAKAQPFAAAGGWLASAAQQQPCSGRQGGAAHLRNEHHARQAGSAASCHEPREALPQQQPGQQGSEDWACVEDDSLSIRGGAERASGSVQVQRGAARDAGHGAPRSAGWCSRQQQLEQQGAQCSPQGGALWSSLDPSPCGRRPTHRVCQR